MKTVVACFSATNKTKKVKFYSLKMLALYLSHLMVEEFLKLV